MYNYRYLLIIDASACIPNADPMLGMQRQANGYGIISQFCVKNKIRKYLNYTYSDQEDCKVLHYCDDDTTILERLEKELNKKPKDVTDEDLLKYIDIRSFGCCDLSSSFSHKITSAVGIPNLYSVDKINMIDMNVNRSFMVDKKENGNNDGSGYNIPNEIMEYGLFVAFSGVDARQAKLNGLTDKDMDYIFEGMMHMFDYDQSSARPLGSMKVRKLFVWKWNEKKYVEDQVIEDSIEIRKKPEIIIPHSYKDYEVTAHLIDELPFIEYDF